MANTIETNVGDLRIVYDDEVGAIVVFNKHDQIIKYSSKEYDEQFDYHDSTLRHWKNSNGYEEWFNSNHIKIEKEEFDRLYPKFKLPANTL